MSFSRTAGIKSRAALLASGATLALGVALLGLPAPALAQETDAVAPDEIEEGQEAEATEETNEDGPIVVTGSRIANVGFSSPTPVTVSTAEQLRAASPLVIEGLKDLPMLQVSGSRASGSGGGGGGQATINLRVLGASRVLVLLDGRRVSPARGNGEVDVSLLPNILVDHVDIVTGGASAAYGSDAVAGVVNFVLNKGLDGIKGSVYGGISNFGDRPEFGGEIGVGFGFADGRGHFLTALDYTDQNGLRLEDRPFTEQGLFLLTQPNAAARPIRVRGQPGHFTNGTDYGLVTSGALRGLTFDPDGTPRQFNYGTLAGTQAQFGGDGNLTQVGREATLSSWLNRYGMFNRISFEVSDNVEIFAENQLSHTANISSIGTGYLIGGNAYTIRQDNAFLDPTIRARMVATNTASFRLNRFNGDFPNNDIHTSTFVWRPVVGANFNFGDWDGEVYFTPSYAKRRLEYHVGTDVIRAIQAADAVIAPVGNTVGAVPGSVVCRATLTNTTFQGTPCIPLNVMGTGSPAAIAAVNRAEEWNQDVYKQQIFSASMSGTLLELPAGPLSTAFGVDYRHESLDFTSDPYSQVLNPINGALGGWRAGNAQPYSGTQAVKEGFVELNAPLLDGAPFADSLILNGAARITDYRTSGTVFTWKVGVMWRPISDLLIRGTRSRDIRAPTLSELYNAGTAGTGEFRDPFNGNITIGGVKTFNSGNPLLEPEIGDTTVIGATYQPSYIPGLNMSVDYWDIHVEGFIGTIPNQQIIDDCYANPGSFQCSLIIRDAAGNITTILNQPINYSIRTVRGIDGEISYRRNLGWLDDSDVSFRLVATHLIRNDTDANGIINESAGEVGDPKWKVLFQSTLTTGPVQTTLSGHYISGACYDNAWVSGVDIDDNCSISDYMTWDGRIAYQLPSFEDVTVYLSVSNLFNRDPVKVYSNDNVNTSTAPATYDIIGRYFRAGINFEF